MKKVLKIFSVVLICLLIFAAIIIGIVHYARGYLKNEELPAGYTEKLNNDAFENTADVRIMSSNLLVHYKSWGGSPAKPRAKKYIEMLNAYNPDVVGLQEMSDEWYSCIMNNLPEGYKMLYPIKSGTHIFMTAMLYNENTLELIDSGDFKYQEGENPRLRRVVWAVFKEKQSGKVFAVTNTHFSLIFDEKNPSYADVMRSQAAELTEFIYKLSEDNNCPVFSVGDYNTMEDVPQASTVDIPEIYNTLSQKLTDTKYIAENKICGDAVNYDYPSWDHIFLYGNAGIHTFSLLSYDYLTDISDHYPIFTDITLE